MNSAIERLITLRVSDVMSKQVISVTSNDTMANAAKTFQDHSISGVPVVDDAGKCSGVLSALDFVKKHACRCGGNGGGNCSNKGEAVTQIEARRDEPVAEYMNRSVQSVRPVEPLLDAARKMCANHIHRLPVLDEQGRPIGIVTSLDIVAALVNAIEE